LYRAPDVALYGSVLGTDSYEVWFMPTVLGELDRHKDDRSRKERADQAQRIVKRLKGLRDRGTPLDGVAVTRRIRAFFEGKEPLVSMRGTPKSQPAAGSQELELTAPNLICGTPAYLSPEAAMGERVDHRTDLYSLGCVAYWMLTGHQVFTAQTVMQMIVQQVQATPEAPSLHSPSPVPAALDELVLACLAKDPSDRPASVWEVADRLAECQVRSSWTRDDARLWWETRLEPEPMVVLGD
jgi:serine/threonine protein kinase